MNPLIILAIIILSVDLLRYTIAVTYYDCKNQTHTKKYHKKVDQVLYRLWLLTLIILGSQH